jgi:hypothetical protein
MEQQIAIECASEKMMIDRMPKTITRLSIIRN